MAPRHASAWERLVAANAANGTKREEGIRALAIFSQRAGEVIRRIAAPMVGVMITAPLLSLCDLSDLSAVAPAGMN